MVDWLIPGAALLAGLAGSGHCLAMCGGIMGALSLGAVGSRRQRLARIMTMNLGKALSYSLAGALAGGLGGVIGNELAALQLGQALRWASAAILVAIGLRLLLGLQLLGPIERAGGRLWQRLQPAWQRVLPIDSPAKALGAGLLWGWLPCGLVYSQLALAVTTGSAVTGAFTLLAFGLGTALSLTGLAAALNFLGIKGLPARATGVLLIVFGVWIAMPWAGRAGERNAHPHTATTLRVTVVHPTSDVGVARPTRGDWQSEGIKLCLTCYFRTDQKSAIIDTAPFRSLPSMTCLVRSDTKQSCLEKNTRHFTA